MISLSFTIISAVFFTLSVNANILYVKQMAKGSGDGTSWANAFTNLQDAIAASESGDKIWVSQGVYTPGTSRNSTFQMREGVGIYGGFIGNETSREQRGWEINATTLSGDLDGNDGQQFINNSENAYHVVTGAKDCTLDGFIITGGNANGGGYDNYGG